MYVRIITKRAAIVTKYSIPILVFVTLCIIYAKNILNAPFNASSINTNAPKSTPRFLITFVVPAFPATFFPYIITFKSFCYNYRKHYITYKV